MLVARNVAKAVNTSQISVRLRGQNLLVCKQIRIGTVLKFGFLMEVLLYGNGLLDQEEFNYGLGVVPTIEEPINMYCDNTGAITIANESGITKGVRHFHARVHYLREVIEFGYIKLEKVHTDDNLADPFTKALAFPKHSEHTKNIGMLPASSLM
ncbi:hypothetical protein Tco_0672693 [Tanacetum coccineum]